MSKVLDKSLIINKLKSAYNFSSDSEFARFLGVKPTTLSSWHSRNTFDIDLIYAKCVDVNSDFLLSGNEPILKTKSDVNTNKNDVSLNVSQNVEKQKVNKKLTNRPTYLSEPLHIYNINNKGVPLIPIDAMAGFGTGSTQVMDYDTKTYVVPEFTELKVDFMIPVKGSSMYPKYNSGDLVACKKLNINDLFFQWNKVYVLDTEQGALIKRIKKATESDHILLVSDNENYDPFEIHLSKVYAVALVVGVIRLE